MANFNGIAKSYDFLKHIVFGEELEKASNYFLDEIQSNSKILIVGGGTGKILRNFKSAQEILYLELSQAMIDKSKEINSPANVEFIQTDILEWTTEKKFDFVITPFVLDCFNNSELNIIFTTLKKALNEEGKWIQTDFYPKKNAHKLLIKIMYLFFNLSNILEVKKLADFDSLFKKHHFILERNARFYHSMVESKIYKQID